MKCPIVSFEVSVGLVWLLAICILMLRVMFLHCWRISLICLSLKLVGSWVDFFSLECNEVSGSEFWDVSGFGVTLSSLYIEAQGYVPALLENLHGLSCSETCWLLGCAWFQCRYGGFWMSSYRLMFPGVRSSLVFSSFVFKPLASDFQSYSYSSLKTSPAILHQW